MGVAAHLNIELTEYDQRIRTFIPHYEEMLDVAADTLLAFDQVDPIVVELGIGTGALAMRALARRPGAQLLGIDADPAILKLAAKRLAPLGAQVHLIARSFTELPLKRCQIVLASFALHHLPDRESKTRMYAKIFDALTPGGMLVSADAFPCKTPGIAAAHVRAWRAHLEQFYSPDETTRYFQAWAAEDVYFALDDECSMLTAVGFIVDVIWRRDRHAVVAATKPAAA